MNGWKQKLIIGISQGKGIYRFVRPMAYRLGMSLVAEELAYGTDSDVRRFYSSRVSDCDFLADPLHYERPRLQWILERVWGGNLLEIGCGNGGMTAMLAGQTDHVTALDVSSPSLQILRNRRLTNVTTIEMLIEDFIPEHRFDWIVASEVLEHLRSPETVITQWTEWLRPGGSLLLTTPNGHWDSNEHLHEFSLESLGNLLASSRPESYITSYLCDASGCPRWLVGSAKRRPTELR